MVECQVALTHPLWPVSHRPAGPRFGAGGPTLPTQAAATNHVLSPYLLARMGWEEAEEVQEVP